MRYLDKKNLIIFLLFLAIASTFHKSAMLFMVIPLLNSSAARVFLTSKFSVFIILISLVFLFFFKLHIISFIIDSHLIGYFGYDYYLSSDLFFSETEVTTGLGVVAKTLPLVLFVFFASASAKNNRVVSFGIGLSLFYIFLIILTSAISIFSRLEVLFIPVYIIVGFISFSFFSNLRKQLFLLLLISVWGIIFFRGIQVSQSQLCNGLRISPYVSIFNKEDDRSIGVPRTICEYW